MAQAGKPSVGQGGNINEVQLPEEMPAKVNELLYLAIERNTIASESAYAGWVRTGATAIIAALTLVRLTTVGTSPAGKTAGLLILLAAAGIFIVAFILEVRGRQPLRKLGVHTLPTWYLAATSLAFVAAVALGFWLILQEPAQ